MTDIRDSTTANMTESPQRAYCGECLAGRERYPTARLYAYGEDGWICNCCGTTYHNDTIMPDGQAMAQYMRKVISKLREYKSDDIKTIRTMIVPIIWTMFQISHRQLERQRLTCISTDMPFILSFGLHNLASAFGAHIAIGIPAQIWQIHQQYANAPREDSGIRSMPMLIHVTDIYEDKRITGMNSTAVAVLCIKDSRERHKRDISHPRVFPIITER